MTSNARIDRESLEIKPSSGNVFADLGFEEPELELAKAKLALAISQVIRSQRLTQVEAGEMTGLDQPAVSAIVRGRLGGFSIDRLFRTLNALGQDIDIAVHAGRGPQPAHISVRVESISP
jgi:predicted XRE-type DNA-binding protein